MKKITKIFRKFCFNIRPQIQIQAIDCDAVRRALEIWLKSTETDSKQLLKVVIDNISSVRTIHNINKAVSEIGNYTISFQNDYIHIFIVEILNILLFLFSFE